MSDDLLKNIRTKIKPAVENRDTSLNSKILDNSNSINTDTLNSTSQDTSISGNLDLEVSGNTDNLNKGNMKEAQKAPISVSLEQELETKQSTLRLEAGVSERLQSLCRKEGICREVLIEAMFEYIESNPKALGKVLSQAKAKNEYRQRMANRRRAKSMIDRFGG